MTQAIVRGNSITLEATYRDQDGNLATPTNPRISILDPFGATVVANAIPTEVSTGRYEYVYAVAGDATLGAWEADWTGSINGAPVDASEGFTVIAAGSVSVDPTGGPQAGPCAPWITADDVFDCAPCSNIANGSRDAAMAARAADAASELLYEATGRRWPGVCTVTVRPCRTSSCWHGGAYAGGCGCGASSPLSCGCGGLSEIRLPGPVISIDEVLVDGDVIASGGYRVDNWSNLVRLGGESWPSCQDLSLAATEDRTFQVTYRRGRTPPELGLFAATDLACEMYRGAKGEDCRLPQKVTNVVRQGVSMQFVKPAEIGLTKDGEIKTGIANVDLFIAAFGRGGARRRRGSVASPDIGPSVRRVGT